ncbi:MAG: hypothetical protein NXH87_17730 [Rhodobiaceae bacterium]|nr:hypothetical protein [Rhodobiaceae bacterium]
MIVTMSRMGMSLFGGTIATALAYLFSELGIGSIGARPEGLIVFGLVVAVCFYFFLFKKE